MLDLSHIFSGPTCTQLLGDLGADVIKIETPGTGDDAYTWGSSFVNDASRAPTDHSAYFLCINRNKGSITANLASPEGQALVFKLAAGADVVIESFKPSGLKKYGLDVETLLPQHPALIYC